MTAQSPDADEREYTISDKSSFGAAICAATGERTELKSVDVGALKMETGEGRLFADELFRGRVLVAGRLEMVDGKQRLIVTRIVRRLERDTTKSEAEEYAEQHRPAAEQGDIRAQFDLAYRLLTLASTAHEVAEGIIWLRKVAEQDGIDPKNARYAQHLLGAIYGGVPSRNMRCTAKALDLLPAPDYHEALKWYRKVAESGSSEASRDIGQLYEQGTPATPKNYGEAFQWYSKAAAGEDGLYFGTFELAEMHFHGRGVKQDYVEAAKLYRKIQYYNESVLLRLGWMHENGKGVPQDLAEAHKWFSLASGYEGEIRSQGSDGRDRVETRMSDAERAEAWRRYEQYKDEARARNGA